jgi:outer membrane protein assembly factor BamB
VGGKVANRFRFRIGEVFTITGRGAVAAGFIERGVQTGARKWTAPGPAVPQSGAIADGVFFGDTPAVASPRLVAVDAPTGKVLWTAEAGGVLASTANGAGIAYASTFDGPEQDGPPGDLTALDARTGRRLWKRHFPAGAPIYLEPAGAVVYAGLDAGDVHALDSTTATQSGTRALGPGRAGEFLARVRHRLDALGSPRLTATFVGYLTVGVRCPPSRVSAGS